MEIHSSILAGIISLVEKPGGLQSMRLQRVWHNCASEHTHTISSDVKDLFKLFTISTSISSLKKYLSKSFIHFLIKVSFFFFWTICKSSLGFPGGSADRESTCNVGDTGLIPGLGRSPGEEKGYPLQYSGLENSMNCNKCIPQKKKQKNKKTKIIPCFF